MVKSVLLKIIQKALFKITNESQSLDPGTDYTATIESEVTDVEGNPMYEDKVWTFTTKEEEPPVPEDKKPTIQEAIKKSFSRSNRC